MSESTMRMLKIAAQLKLNETNISVSRELFESFWAKFSYNLDVAWQNEKDKLSCRVAVAEEKVAASHADLARFIAIPFAIGWIVGRLQGIF